MMIDRKLKSFEVKCPNCSKLRFVTYAQSWNIKVGKSSGKCKSCNPNINKSGLKLGHGWNRGLEGFRKGHQPHFIATGKDNPSWKGGITSLNAKIRNSKAYSDWRKSVFERDDYTCQTCGVRGVKLNADHIIPFSKNKELRLSLENGRTLCIPCHKNTETYAGKVFKYAVPI